MKNKKNKDNDNVRNTMQYNNFFFFFQPAIMIKAMPLIGLCISASRYWKLRQQKYIKIGSII